MNNNITVLDSRQAAIDLAKRLGSLDHFLDAINDIITFTGRSEDCELQRYGRKIIALTETARITLNRVGVKIYLFVVCSETLLPYKSAYFKLLVVIKSRKCAFPSDIMMDERITVLLSALCPNFEIRCRGVDPRAQLGIAELLVPQTRQLVPFAAARSSAQKSYAGIDVMQSPDDFVKKRQRINQMGEFVRLQAATKYYRTGVAPKYPVDKPEPKRLVPRQYPAGNPEEKRLVPRQYPAGNPEEKRLVPRQYPAGNPEEKRLVPRQYPAGNPGEQRLVPRQYPAGNPGEKRLVPRQYPAGNPEAQLLVPKQYPAGDVKPGDNAEPPRPRRLFTRTNAQYFDLVVTENGKELVPRPWN